MSSPTSTYRGRFAPSPTGPLHFGSLVAALGSFLDARAHNGTWHVRIEDIDPPRAVLGAADNILHTLEQLALTWDGDVMYQSRRYAAYAEAVARLRVRGAIYPCACSRKEIADSALVGVEGPVYPGTCRNGIEPGRNARALRTRVDADVVRFTDLIRGDVSMNLAQEIGDFVVKRADGLYAYQLAVVVDDAAQGITHVVRGADLLGSTTRQIHLQRLLGLPTPIYAHLPVVLSPSGEKLSKQTGAAAINVKKGGTALYDALTFLGQAPPPDLAREKPEVVVDWGRAHWNLSAVPR
ncbi:MAG: tRNA glutamyl-Q(34) synthetase GluQRS [Gammaproteobacteria bacterium]